MPNLQQPNILRLTPFLGLILVVLLGACVRTGATLLDPTAPRYERVHADSVRIFMDPAELDSLDFVRIAIIEASGPGERTSQIDMLEAMRRKAGELGANGVLLPRIDEPSAGAKVAATIFKTDTERKGTVVAIRVLGPRKKTGQSPSTFLSRLADRL